MAGGLEFLALTSGEGTEISGPISRWVGDSRDHINVEGRCLGPYLDSVVERFKGPYTGGAGWIPGVIYWEILI